jgi:hypothetical protein
MSNPLLAVKPYVIGGRNYAISVLPFAKSREVYSKLQSIISVNEETLNEAGVGLFMLAGLAGHMPDEDLKFYITAFGPTTTVEIDAQRRFDLGDDIKRGIVFADRFEELFEWLDACVEVNFGGVIAKQRAARSAMQARRAAKAEADETT